MSSITVHRTKPAVCGLGCTAQLERRARPGWQGFFTFHIQQVIKKCVDVSLSRVICVICGGLCAAAGRGAAVKARAVPAGCCSSLPGRHGCQHRRQPSSPISSSRLGLSFMPSGAEFKLLQPIVELSGGTAPVVASQPIYPNISARPGSSLCFPQASPTTLTAESSATTSLPPAGSSLPRSCGSTAKVRLPL